MPASSERQNTLVYSYECDRCHATATETVDLALGDPGLIDSMPKGWMQCADPGGDEDLFFHTRRCAIGWFRAFVAEQYGQDDPEGPFTEADAEQAGESVELLNAAYQARRGKRPPITVEGTEEVTEQPAQTIAEL